MRHPLRVDLYIDIHRYIIAARYEQLTLQLSHRPPGLIDSLICVGVSSRIGVGDSDSPKSFPRHFTRSLAALQPERIEQRVIFIRVTMRPAIHSDRRDVARWIEPSRSQRSSQLFADLALHGFKRRVV